MIFFMFLCNFACLLQACFKLACFKLACLLQLDFACFEILVDSRPQLRYLNVERIVFFIVELGFESLCFNLY